MDKFWMVFVEGKGGPTRKHESLELAMWEADRLAMAQGKPAYVLESVKVCKVAGVEWEDLE